MPEPTARDKVIELVRPRLSLAELAEFLYLLEMLDTESKREILRYGRERSIMPNRKCPSCDKPYKGFRDQASIQEYRITQMCQDCQDKLFGLGDTPIANGHCPNCGEYFYSEHDKYSPCCSDRCWNQFKADVFF